MTKKENKEKGGRQEGTGGRKWKNGELRKKERKV